jgi:hypothetical protein
MLMSLPGFCRCGRNPAELRQLCYGRCNTGFTQIQTVHQDENICIHSTICNISIYLQVAYCNLAAQHVDSFMNSFSYTRPIPRQLYSNHTKNIPDQPVFHFSTASRAHLDLHVIVIDSQSPHGGLWLSVTCSPTPVYAAAEATFNAVFRRSTVPRLDPYRRIASLILLVALSPATAVDVRQQPHQSPTPIVGVSAPPWKLPYSVPL